MKRFLALILASTLTLTLAGCATNQNSSSPQQNAGEDVASGTRTDLKIGISTKAETLNPYEQTSDYIRQATNQCYDTLLSMESGKDGYGPRLAMDAAFSEDNLSVTFTLRENVKFHDGTVMDADDVVFSFEKAMESAFMTEYVNNVTAVEGSGNTVTIHLADVDCDSLIHLNRISIVSKEAYEADGNTPFADKAVGTGPYKLDSFELATGNMELSAFDDYWGEAGPIKNISFKVVSDSNTLAIELENGSIDYAMIDSSAYSVINDNDSLEITYGGSSYRYLFIMNTNHEPLNNPEIRKAIAHALDYDLICSIVTEDVASKVYRPYGIAGLENPITEDEVPVYDYDVDKAKQILADAGITTPINIGTFKIGGNTKHKTLAEAVQQMLLAAGMEMEIEQMDSNVWMSEIMQQDFDFIIFLGGTTGYSWNAATAWVTSDNFDGRNYGHYQNDRVDELAHQIAMSFDVEEQRELYLELCTIIQNELPVINLLSQDTYVAHNKNLVFESRNNFEYEYKNFHWQ